MGRVLGSLCVISGRDEDAESGMLASWISQASFDPPGLTVAVKKDRAVENLLQTGNRFNVNVLKDGGDKVRTDQDSSSCPMCSIASACVSSKVFWCMQAIMKQLLKPFKPAEPRFAGLDTEVSEETGAVILKEGAAVLECTVKNRLEVRGPVHNSLRLPTPRSAENLSTYVHCRLVITGSCTGQSMAARFWMSGLSPLSTSARPACLTESHQSTLAFDQS